MTFNNIDFGRRLKMALENAKITQKDFADKSGISKTSINNYVQGRIPETLILYNISCLLDVSMEWLLTGENRGSTYVEPSEEDKDLIDLENQLLEPFNELDRDNKLKIIGEVNMLAKMSKQKKEKSSTYRTTKRKSAIISNDSADIDASSF